MRQDVHIPLDPAESEKLVEKLNHLIPERKAEAAESVKLASEEREEAESERDREIPVTRKPA